MLSIIEQLNFKRPDPPKKRIRNRVGQGKGPRQRLDVVNKIAETDTDWNDAPLDPQVIRTITVDTFGVDYPEPEKC